MALPQSWPFRPARVQDGRQTIPSRKHSKLTIILIATSHLGVSALTRCPGRVAQPPERHRVMQRWCRLALIRLALRRRTPPRPPPVGRIQPTAIPEEAQIAAQRFRTGCAGAGSPISRGRVDGARDSRGAGGAGIPVPPPSRSSADTRSCRRPASRSARRGARSILHARFGLRSNLTEDGEQAGFRVGQACEAKGAPDG